MCLYFSWIFLVVKITSLMDYKPTSYCLKIINLQAIRLQVTSLQTIFLQVISL